MANYRKVLLDYKVKQKEERASQVAKKKAKKDE